MRQKKNKISRSVFRKEKIMNYYNNEGQSQNKTSEPAALFHGNGFILNIPEDWQDKTVYTIIGPIEKGIQHNIIIMVDYQVEYSSVAEYADSYILALDEQLKGYRLLKQGVKNLTNGLPAYEVIFRWYATDELRIYQQQIFILSGDTGYRLTASFSKKTRRTLGPLVEKMMLSFQPVASSPPA